MLRAGAVSASVPHPDEQPDAGAISRGDHDDERPVATHAAARGAVAARSDRRSVPTSCRWFDEIGARRSPAEAMFTGTPQNAVIRERLPAAVSSAV